MSLSRPEGKALRSFLILLNLFMLPVGEAMEGVWAIAMGTREKAHTAVLPEDSRKASTGRLALVLLSLIPVSG